VTRCVCENIGQNVAKLILAKIIHTSIVKNCSPRICATFVIKKKTVRSNQPPNRRKFAQSSHPAGIRLATLALIKAAVVHQQGDRMSLLRNRPKGGEIRFLPK
jgi:hypothetical protein